MKVKVMTGGMVAAVATAALAGGVGTAAAGPNGDNVSGGGGNGNLERVDNNFNVNAQSGPNGEDARGQFKFKDTESGPPNEEFTAEVTCLRVAGNLATFVGRIEKSKNSVAEGRYVIVRVEDNGPPRGGESRDEIRNAIQPKGGPQPSCPRPADIADRGLSHGNITVSDG